MEVVTANPCRGVASNPVFSRERILTDTEIAMMWQECNTLGVKGMALKTILLTGQRPGEVAHMRWEHIADRWWTLPGQPCEGWLGTKNGRSHRVWLTEAVQGLFPNVDKQSGFVFGVSGLDRTMKAICAKLKIAKATPRDLRRTFGSTVTRLDFSRSAMDRLLNHADHSIASVYDRHSYASEDRRIMEVVSQHITSVAEGRQHDTVVRGRFNSGNN
jgi:integrase